MCQSSVWALYPDGQKERIAENASYVRQEGADVIVGSFMTKPERLAGSIVEIDAMAHTITVRVARPPEVALETRQARAPTE
jgi:predicted RNA-binding protein